MNKLFFFLASPIFLNAQPRPTTPVPFAGYDFLNRESVYSHSDTVEIGSYLFPKQASPADVKLKNGRTYKNLNVALNLISNELIFRDSAGRLYTSVVDIDSVEFSPSETCIRKTIFKTGFPKIDDFNEKTFFEILSQGEIQLLRAYKVSYTDKTVLGTSAPVRQYDTKEVLYTYKQKDGIKKLSKNKTEVLQVLNLKNQQIADYLKAHKLNFKSQEDIKALFDYYNSL